MFLSSLKDNVRSGTLSWKCNIPQGNNFISLVLRVLGANLCRALIKLCFLKSGAVGSFRTRKDTAAKCGKVLCHSVWSPCSQGQSWNGLEQIIEADLQNRCFCLRNPDEGSPAVKCVWMSEQLALHLYNTVKLQFQDTDADGVELLPLTVLYACKKSYFSLPSGAWNAQNFYLKMH